MRFKSRVFMLGKEIEHPEHNQDAYRIDAGRGIAAIADGVTAGIFARQWAGILTQAAVAGTPDPEDPTAFAAWLAEQRKAWTSDIDVSQLAWFQKPKLREGAFSTLLWIRLLPADEDEEDDNDDQRPQASWRLRGFAVGDSCLFHFRERKLLRAFPIQNAKQLEPDPVVIGSVDLNRDGLLEFESIDDSCRPGDLLVLCTDAVAEWALRLKESGSPPVWDDYWEMTAHQWQEQVVALRRDGQMRCDDATLVLLRVTDGTTPAEPSDEVALNPQSAGSDRPAEPPPLGDTRDDQDWKDTLKLLSQQLTDQLTDQASRGWQKLREAGKSAESAIRKYRDKFRSDDE